MSKFVSCDQCGGTNYMNGAPCRVCEKDLCDYCVGDVSCPECKENRL